MIEIASLVNEANMWCPSELAKARTAKRRSAIYPRMDATAVSGVLLALLFLLMPGPPDVPHIASVELAAARHSVAQPGAAREDALVVTVRRDGTVFFRNVKISADDLEEQLRSGVREGAEKRVYLRVDRVALYAHVMYALEEIRRAGISDICFLTG